MDFIWCEDLPFNAAEYALHFICGFKFKALASIKTQEQINISFSPLHVESMIWFNCAEAA
jgi:hypothetical protein